MSDMVLRGFVDRCAANRVNSRAMLAYVDCLQKQATELGAMSGAIPGIEHAMPAIRSAGRATVSFLRSLGTPTIPSKYLSLSRVGSNLAVEFKPTSLLDRVMSTPAAKPVPAAGAAAVAGGAGLGAALEGRLAGYLAGHSAPPALGPKMLNPIQGQQLPQLPPAAHGAGLAMSGAGGVNIPGLNPLADAQKGVDKTHGGMIDKAMGFLKAHKGAVGAGAAGAGAAAAGAGYLKSKSKKTDAGKEKTEKKEDKNEE